MEITNEIRRLRGKIQALENGPFVNQIIQDVIEYLGSETIISSDEVTMELKLKYKKRLDILIPKSSSQIPLFDQ